MQRVEFRTGMKQTSELQEELVEQNRKPPKLEVSSQD